MKQRHSNCRLVYHLVLHTKYRLPLICEPCDVEILLGFMKTKAYQLDSYIEEGGGWRDHIHLLLQSRPTISLSVVYGQLKGYSATMWRKRFPNSPFKWGDGVFAKSIDPDECQDLRAYIRYQWRHHENGLVVPGYERTDD
jgi:REP element-mobilizing transposase RayT